MGKMIRKIERRLARVAGEWWPDLQHKRRLKAKVGVRYRSIGGGRWIRLPRNVP